MSFSKCPECGETNYYEQSYTRYFDCGFQASTLTTTREARCGSDDRKSNKRKRAEPTLSDEASRYRLALLDAAHAAEGIAADLRADALPEHAEKCAALARQMREFAGHTGVSGEETPTFRSRQSPGRAIMAIFRKQRWR